MRAMKHPKAPPPPPPAPESEPEPDDGPHSETASSIDSGSVPELKFSLIDFPESDSESGSESYLAHSYNYYSYLDTIRPFLLMCSGALGILGIIPFNIIIYFVIIEIIFQLRLCIIIDFVEIRTRTIAWIFVLLLVFSWGLKSIKSNEINTDNTSKKKSK